MRIDFLASFNTKPLRMTFNGEKTTSILNAWRIGHQTVQSISLRSELRRFIFCPLIYTHFDRHSAWEVHFKVKTSIRRRRRGRTRWRTRRRRREKRRSILEKKRRSILQLERGWGGGGGAQWTATYLIYRCLCIYLWCPAFFTRRESHNEQSHLTPSLPQPVKFPD